jgi:hypothetical protein
VKLLHIHNSSGIAYSTGTWRLERDAIKNFENEANIRGREKTVYVVFKYLSRRA